MWLATFLGVGQAVHTEVVGSEDGGYQLVRDGKPYEMRGAGGHSQLDMLVQVGGNSIRTWSTDHAASILDEAHERGLTVMLGLWVQHERHGFDYNDEESVRQQFLKFQQVVEQYKDHPALLMWGIGNEVDLNYKNTRVWEAINDLAAMIHDADPHHPTTTVTAGLDSLEVQLIRRLAPAIDILSINTYGELKEVPANIERFGWTGPYMITEWGPNGHWEVPKAPWGAPIEQNTTEKMHSYRERYVKYIAPQKKCVGSYVFLWGQKQEKTPTWYGLFTEDGLPLATLDAVEVAWTGELSTPPAVEIGHIIINESTSPQRLATGSYVTIKLEVPKLPTDAEVRWELLHETTSKAAGGDHEDRPPSVPGAIDSIDGATARLKVPSAPGPYRLFAYIVHHGKVSAANIPIYADSESP